MMITPLPSSTIQLLGSAQTLTSSLSLVKELVDNAIDAKATAVDVLISQNTLDRIEVRDNGHGIAPEDLDALGRRGHTSKLRTFEELKSIGGDTLGFRGEALASALQLADVSITTKTEGEVVATTVTLNPTGGVSKQQKASHPVGTTVTVKNFMYKLPVRKQTALKTAKRTVTQIKELLQCYAIARLNTKFTLKVTKDNKGSWSFVPRPAEGSRGAAIQIVGRETVAECFETTLTFSEHQRDSNAQDTYNSSGLGTDSTSDTPNDGYVVELLLPKPAADPVKICQTQYISVDSRPVAPDKGTMKKLISLFKSYLKLSYTENISIKSPFFRMNILCPVASYDPNVEPAKDDIIFSNEDLIINSFEDFLKEFYGELPQTPGPMKKQKVTRPLDDFELLLARKSTVPEKDGSTSPIPNFTQARLSVIVTEEAQVTSSQRDSIEVEDEHPNASIQLEADTPDPGLCQSKWGIDMSNDLSEEVEDIDASSQYHCKEPRFSMTGDVAVEEVLPNEINPWIIAKLTAPVRAPFKSPLRLPRLREQTSQIAEGVLPTPRASSDAIEPKPFNEIPLGVPHQHRPSTSLAQPSSDVLSGEDGNLQVGTNLIRIPKHHQATSSDEAEDEMLLSSTSTGPARHDDFIRARNVTEDIIRRPSISDNLKIPKKTARGPHTLKFSPVANVDNLGHKVDLRQSKLDMSREQSNYQQQATEKGDQVGDADLAWAMEFENKKEELSRQQRQNIKVAKATARRNPIQAEDAETEGDGTKNRRSPHKHRYLAAVATLEQETLRCSADDSTTRKILMPDGDPRAYLIRRQRSMTANPSGQEPSKMSRVKSSRLPLESIPYTNQLHSLALTIASDVISVRELSNYLRQEEAYIATGVLSNGLQFEASDISDIIHNVKGVMEQWKVTRAGEDVEVEYSFNNITLSTR